MWIKNYSKGICPLWRATKMAPTTILCTISIVILIPKNTGTRCYHLVSPRNLHFPRDSIYFKFSKLQPCLAITFTSPQSHWSVNAWEEIQNP